VNDQLVLMADGARIRSGRRGADVVPAAVDRSRGPRRRIPGQDVVEFPEDPPLKGDRRPWSCCPLERTRASSHSSKGRRQRLLAGNIKRVVFERGFGFIAADDGKEYFFHRSGLDSSMDFDRLDGGERVSFEIERSDKGPRARSVRAATS
jgi:cold shock protein